MQAKKRYDFYCFLCIEVYTMKALVIFFSFFLLVSCKKDADKPAEEIVPTIQNVQGTYIQTGLTSQSGTDMWMNVPACKKDDTYSLQSNGSYEVNDAGQACTPSGSFVSTWTLNSYTLSLGAINYTIESFTGKEMQLRYNSGGQMLTASFSKQ
jgi:hypothetical protein